MKKATTALSLGASLGILLSAGAVNAERLKDISCDQFLAMDESQQDDMVYWISGIETAASNKEVGVAEIDVAYDAFGQPLAAVITACEGDKKASLWAKIKEHF
ncbi:HdeA/HdeB family chaperone [Thiohalocapsa halophila]|jgi:hypothetical protein